MKKGIESDRLWHQLTGPRGWKRGRKRGMWERDVGNGWMGREVVAAKQKRHSHSCWITPGIMNFKSNYTHTPYTRAYDENLQNEAFRFPIDAFRSCLIFDKLMTWWVERQVWQIGKIKLMMFTSKYVKTGRWLII